LQSHALHGPLKYWHFALNVGWGQAVFYVLQRLRHASSRSRHPYVLYSKQLRFPVYCRPHTTDVNVFNQVLLRREYRCLDNVRDPALIIDCGANVGYSAAYFLSRFPRAYLVAVEPDPGNFEMLRTNLRPFVGRCQVVCSAVWSYPARVALAEASLGAGQEWARQVRPAQPDDLTAFSATDVGTLLRNSGFDRISILKVDIEGAEADVFAHGYAGWLSKVDNLVIELHGDECEAILAKAVEGQQFERSRCEELHVYTRLRGATGQAIADMP
jgi:FkbM family methyltransferase